MMKFLCLLASTCLFSTCLAVHYDDHEISQLTLDKELRQLSENYHSKYFTAADPAQVVDQIIAADLIPLHKEAILFNLLTAISQQPPQKAHQYLVDTMKSYPTTATMIHDEGRLPVAVFNLNSKAYGIENIWLAYRSEQEYSQLLRDHPDQALKAFKQVLTEQSRPKWLAVKNSLAAADKKSKSRIINSFLFEIQANQGFDRLISHLGLTTGNPELIAKALRSTDRTVREYTLRSVGRHFSVDFTRQLLMQQATVGQDQVFTTTLLAGYSSSTAVEKLLLNQLKQANTATAAAFALSQSTAPGLPDRLYQTYRQTTHKTQQNHLLMALKLHPSAIAQSLSGKLEAEYVKRSLGDRS
ncbi:hypothetical protein ACFODZ_06630 [Marinicella sediminis]|uniref:HEAT repeat domain-containing protein n=1 Tax=Marinicella sediminis TaxID=1792834 RepID=A0ABV7J6Z8_9GAMM|nr:hypothetical protein [Marinicella sediminis]